jgi:hypothetical protein
MMRTPRRSMPFAGRHLADLAFGADQHRNHQPGIAGLDGAAQGFGIAGVGHRDGNGLHALGHLEHMEVALLAVGDGDLRQGHARALDLLGGRHHLGRAVDDLQPVLVDALAIEQQVVVVLEALGTGDGDGEGVANGDGAPELEGLAHIDGARPRKLGAENGGNQHAAPHGVADHLAELAGAGKLRVHVGGVDVARHHRKKVDVFGAQGADQERGIAHGDFVKGPVLDEIVGLACHGVS